MKLLKLIILVILINFNTTPIAAQISENPIGVLSEKLLQNELISNRFIRDFVFIKTNTFKKKTMADMDKSVALFDDNLSYIVLHLPGNNKVKQDFIKLQNLWNIYRIKITEFDSDNYQSLITRTLKLRKYIRQLSNDIFDKHPDYSKHKKSIELARLAAENSKKIDAIATVYTLKNAMNVTDAGTYFDVDMTEYKKNLKKIGKLKSLDGRASDLIEDLKVTLESIKILLQKEKFNPKMMYAYNSTFGKKNFKLFNYIIQTIK